MAHTDKGPKAWPLGEFSKHPIAGRRQLAPITKGSSVAASRPQHAGRAGEYLHVHGEAGSNIERGAARR
jgi:hypothetical protein